MAFILLFAFIAIPIIEISVFIEVGGRIGLWPTILIVILTAMIGTWMLRQQGLSVLFRIRENLDANRVPVRELFDGVCLVVAGAFLLTPGFVTDAIGFLLFVPAIRSVLAATIAARVIARADVHVHGRSHGGWQEGSGANPRDGGGPIIDGDFEEVRPEDAGPDRPQLDQDDDRDRKS